MKQSVKLGHVGMVNIQTYVFRRCMFEGTRMRTYDYYVNALMHKRDEEFQHSQHDEQCWGRFKGPPSASEWALGRKLCKTEVEDER